MEKLILKNGQEVNLEVKYTELFKFQNNYKDAKDLIIAVTEKKAVEHEVIMQMIYVGYLGGGNTEPLLNYTDFLNELNFDFKRDVSLFGKLVGTNEEKN
jgi:hypothetical protein